jgi:hypothetical protein
MSNEKPDLEVGREPAIAWSGDDPVAYSRAMAALDEAAIPRFDIEEHDQFVAVPQIAGAGYRVIVAKSDAARAQKAIREAFADVRPAGDQ